MAVAFNPSPKKFWCAYNISEDCIGMVDLLDAYMDENGDIWDVCNPCAAHEKVTVERLKKDRRQD